MPAKVNKSEMEDVMKRNASLAIIKKIVENSFGGECDVSWETEEISISILPGKEFECAKAIEKALRENEQDVLYRDLGEEEHVFVGNLDTPDDSTLH